MHDLKVVSAIQDLRQDEETYTWFLNKILPCVVGRASYMERTNQVPTGWASNSSEAFTLLCVENYYDHITDLAKNKPEI